MQPGGPPNPFEEDGELLETAELPRPTGTMYGDDVPVRRRRARRSALTTLAVVGLVGGATAVVLVFLLGRVDSDRLGDAVPAPVREAVSSLGASAGDDAVVIHAPGAQAISGVVYVDSTPAGAAVRLDGAELGTTPLMVQRRLGAGPVRIELRKPGYRLWRREVTPKDGGLRVDATLRRR